MKKILLLIGTGLLTLAAFSQKKPLDHTVYDGWQHIGEKLVSNDGQWLVYTIDPQLGDNELQVRSATGNYMVNIPRGYNAMITDDSRFLVCRIRAPYKETREARIKKKKQEDMPKDSLAILELGKEKVWKTEKVRSYKLPAKAGNWVAYQLDKPIEQPGKKLPEKKVELVNTKTVDSLNHIIDSLQGWIQNLPKKYKRKDDDSMEDADGDEAGGGNGELANDLVLRNLNTGEELVFYKVLEYYLNKQGDKLLVEQARNPADSFSMRQVLLYDMVSARSKVLSRGGNDFRNFAMTDDGSSIAYLAEREAQPKDLLKFYRLWSYRHGMDSAVVLLDRYSIGMHLGMTVSEFGSLSFSKSGQRLFFGVAPIPVPRDTSLVDFEHAKMDLWHYKDDYLQTVQTLPARLRAEQQMNYLAFFDFPSLTIHQLGTKEIPTVLTTKEGDGDVFVGITDVGKRIESQWQGNTKKDIYSINVLTGEKKLIKQDLSGNVYPSYTGKYIAWYDRVARNYFSWNGTVVKNLSEKIKYPLYNEENDLPDDPGNYGVMGWHEGDSLFYVYDRYDVWAIDPEAKADPAIFNISGRNTQLESRYVPVDPEQKYFRSGQRFYWRMVSQKTKASSIAYQYKTNYWGSPVTVTAPGNYQCGIPVKAKDADLMIYTRETFEQNPDLYVSMPGNSGINPAAKPVYREQKITAINPQQSNYSWGTAELFNWKAYNGKEATGVVYKPENFDPKKKYPMIIYFYEKLSQDLYDYKEPAPIRSAVNIPFFVSRGYIVFTPDIEYKTGHPGQGAYDYIVSGARAIVKKGWADSTKLAIQGHSWGGYQAAQLATMTKLFKAVWAGAPVANMTSAYGGIRWESGVNRQFQYEKSQSRIGGTLWEKLPLYLENSPLFHLEKVTAPLVIMANDNDGAVPWYQGIELFTAMRRLNKPVWMFNYNGQGHGLTQRQDMLDYQIRMQQFFDWILKGEKPARWITDGVPAVMKGKDWGID